MKTILLYLIFILVFIIYFVNGDINYYNAKDVEKECKSVFPEPPTNKKDINILDNYAINTEDCNNRLDETEKLVDVCCYISVKLINKTWYNYCGKLKNEEKGNIKSSIDNYITQYQDDILGDDNDKKKKNFKIDCLGKRFNFKFIILLISLLLIV